MYSVKLFGLPGCVEPFKSVLVDAVRMTLRDQPSARKLTHKSQQFHDANPYQYRVACALAESSQSITLIGDPDQASELVTLTEPYCGPTDWTPHLDSL